MVITDDIRRLQALPYASEDDVREEFVTPLLRLLGYDFARGEIVRARPLPTPYLSGTKRKEHIIPDYIVYCDGRPVFVIDAKSPAENPRDSNYVSQVHSYASHRSVRTDYFILTNATLTLVFETNVSSFTPEVAIELSELDKAFPDLFRFLGAEIWRELIRIKKSYMAVEAFVLKNPDLAKDERLVDDVVFSISEHLARVTPMEPRPEAPLYYLDTSTVFLFNFGSSQEAKAIRDKIQDAEIAVSSYVLKELNQTIVKDAIYLLNIIEPALTLADAIGSISTDNTFGGSRSRRILSLLGFCMRHEISKEQLVRTLKMIIKDGAMGLLPPNTKIIDVLECPLADAQPERQDTGFTLYSTCTRNHRQCRITELIQSKTVTLDKIADTLSGRDWRGNLPSLVRKIRDEAESARGIHNCTRLGDVILALQQPEGSILLTRDRQFAHISEALGHAVGICN